MAKQSGLERAIQSLENQIEVLTLARQKLLEQHQAQRDKKKIRRPRAVAREETAS